MLFFLVSHAGVVDVALVVTLSMIVITFLPEEPLLFYHQVFLSLIGEQNKN